MERGADGELRRLRRKRSVRRAAAYLLCQLFVDMIAHLAVVYVASKGASNDDTDQSSMQSTVWDHQVMSSQDMSPVAGDSSMSVANAQNQPQDRIAVVKLLHNAIAMMGGKYHPGLEIKDFGIAAGIRFVFFVGYMVSLFYAEIPLQNMTKTSSVSGKTAGSSSSDAKEPSLRLPQAFSAISWLFITTKCILRLIDFTINPTSRETNCFWICVALTGIFSLSEMLLTEKIWRARRREVLLGRRQDELELSEPLLKSEGESASKKPGETSVEIDEEEEERIRLEELQKKKVNFKQLLGLCYPDRYLLFVAFICLLVASTAQIFIPRYTGYIIDAVVVKPVNEDALRHYTLKLLLAAFVCSIFTGTRSGVFSICISKLKVRVSRQLFHALLQQEIGFFDTTKIGDMTSRLNADTSRMSDQIGLNLNIFLRSSVQAIGTLVFMILISWKLTLVSFMSIPIVSVVSKHYGEFLRNYYVQLQEKLADANSVAEESLGSMHTVRFFASEDQEEKYYAKKMDEYFGLQKRLAVIFSYYSAGTTFMPSIVVGLVLFYGGRLVQGDSISGGELVSFQLYMVNLSSALDSMGYIYSGLSGALGAADKVFELMNRVPKRTAPGALVTKDFTGTIALNDVSFRYPGRPKVQVLNGLTMTVNPGEVVALVGPSGGGKSSCVKLVESLYEAESGSVLVDGRPIHEYDPKFFHKRIGIVGQEPVLYGRSIRRNIIYGLEGEPDEPTIEEVIEAAKLANAHTFISGMPDGYETEVGEKGVQLSGGQKQRIAIARALVRKPQVLLLDEATSALDAESEHLVQDAIDRIMVNTTVLVIAHRLSTVQHADRILVIEGGKIIEEGKHEQLWEQNGTYAKMVKRQLRGSSSVDDKELKDEADSDSSSTSKNVVDHLNRTESFD